MNRPTVCLLLEGTYPYVRGGVSAWVHQLILSLPDFDFALYCIVAQPPSAPAYELPANVTAIKVFALASTEPQRTRQKGHEADASKAVEAHRGLLEMDDAAFGHLLDFIRTQGGRDKQDRLKTPLWEYVVERYNQNNPFYSVSEYYWSWLNSHQALFGLLQDDVPKADVYHAVSTGYAGLMGCLAKHLYHKPFILTEHGIYHHEREMEIRNSDAVRGYYRDMWINFYKGLSRIIYRRADKIIALFEQNVVRQISLGADPLKTEAIPNGIDLDRFLDLHTEKRPGYHIGLVGRVVPIKDVKTFISFAMICHQRMPECHFWMVGPTEEDEEYFHECQELVSTFGLADVFTFTGAQDVRDYYRFLDLMVLSSLSEAQPLVLLEAFAAGVPCISTQVGNVDELLEYDSRLYASPRDAEGLANAAQFVHDHSDFTQELIARNRVRVIKYYNKTDVFERYKKLYLSYNSGEPS